MAELVSIVGYAASVGAESDDDQLVVGEHFKKGQYAKQATKDVRKFGGDKEEFLTACLAHGFKESFPWRALAQTVLNKQERALLHLTIGEGDKGAEELFADPDADSKQLVRKVFSAKVSPKEYAQEHLFGKPVELLIGYIKDGTIRYRAVKLWRGFSDVTAKQIYTFAMSLNRESGFVLGTRLAGSDEPVFPIPNNSASLTPISLGADVLEMVASKSQPTWHDIFGESKLRLPVSGTLMHANFREEFHGMSKLGNIGVRLIHQKVFRDILALFDAFSD